MDIESMEITEKMLATLTFPLKLFQVLADEKHRDLIAWRDNGYCFQIIDEKRFMSEIVPLYFKQKKWTSFQRQLNIYEFRKIHHGSDKDCYYHPYFKRDHKELVFKMKRNAVKRSMSSEDSAWTITGEAPPSPVIIDAAQPHPAHQLPLQQPMFRAIPSYHFPPNMHGMPQYYFIPANYPYPQGPPNFYSYSPLTNNLMKKQSDILPPPPSISDSKITLEEEEAEQANRTQALFTKTIQFLDHFEDAPAPCGVPHTHEVESFDMLFDKFESIDSHN